MPEYIDREEIYRRWNAMPAPASVASLSAAIQQTPAADVAPVRRGRLVNANRRAKTYQRICTVCGGIAYFCGVGCSYKFCPNCGADMRGSNDE